VRTLRERRIVTEFNAIGVFGSEIIAGRQSERWTRFPQGCGNKGRRMISAGTILVENGTPVPDFIRSGTESYPKAWTSLAKPDSFRDFEKKLAVAGWTFFYLASQVRSIAFGFDKQKRVDAALKRLMEKAKLESCNSLEIDAVTHRSFWGIPYLNLSGHPRRIQKGAVFGH
jgi:hypothetical protein